MNRLSSFRSSRGMMTPMADESNQTPAGLIAQAHVRPDQIALRLGESSLTYRAARRARPAGCPRAGHAGRATRRSGGDHAAQLDRVLRGRARLRAGSGRSSCRSTSTSRPTRPAGSSRDSGATAVVVAARDLLPALEQVPDVPRLVVGDGGYEAALDAAPDGEVEVADVIGDGWPTTMAYTSGTTGRPKGVAIGRDDFRRRAAGVAAAVASGGASVPTTCTWWSGPLYHSGPSYWAQMHLAFGATVVIMARWDAEEALALIERRPGHEHAHGAGQLPAHPRAARGDARPRTTSRR